jgi:DNA-binding HxlR family transcriptional regulator
MIAPSHGKTRRLSLAQVLWALRELTADGLCGFHGCLERVEGVSQKSLTATLRGLERDGPIRRTVTVQVLDSGGL